MTDRPTQLLTVAEVADWLRVEPRYVYRLASSGELIRVYIGRYVRIPASLRRGLHRRAHRRGGQAGSVSSSWSSRPPSSQGGARCRTVRAVSAGSATIRRLPSGRWQARYPALTA